jgi:hypothetical protein
MARFGMALEPRLLQICELCEQEILPGRQLPMNAILIEGYAMCPQCRQFVSAAKQRDEKYIKDWQQFTIQIKLDL